MEKYHKNRPHLARFITEVIAQDPRPAYQQGKETDRIYGISLYEFNIKWRIKAGTTDCVEILDIQKLKEQKKLTFVSFLFIVLILSNPAMHLSQL